MKSKSKKVLVKGEIIWPLHYYFFETPGYQYWQSKSQGFVQFDYLLLDQSESRNNREKLLYYQKSEFSFRKWWWPDFKKLTPYNYFNYLLFREIWNKEHEVKANLYKSKEFGKQRKRGHKQ